MPQDLPPSTWSRTLILHALTSTLYPLPHPMPSLWTFVLYLTITFWRSVIISQQEFWMDLLIYWTWSWLEPLNLLVILRFCLITSILTVCLWLLTSKCTVEVPISQLLGRFITLRKLLFLSKWIIKLCSVVLCIPGGRSGYLRDLLLVAAMCIPQLTVKRWTNSLWINKGILLLIKKKKKPWHQLKAQPWESLRQKFKELRSTVKKLITSEYHKYLQHFSDVLKENPKRFWSYHSIKSKSKRLPDISTYNGITAIITITITFIICIAPFL